MMDVSSLHARGHVDVAIGHVGRHRVQADEQIAIAEGYCGPKQCSGNSAHAVFDNAEERLEPHGKRRPVTLAVGQEIDRRGRRNPFVDLVLHENDEDRWRESSVLDLVLCRLIEHHPVFHGHDADKQVVQPDDELHDPVIGIVLLPAQAMPNAIVKLLSVGGIEIAIDERRGICDEIVNRLHPV